MNRCTEENDRSRPAMFLIGTDQSATRAGTFPSSVAVGSSRDACCLNDPLSTEISRTEESGFQRCSNVLLNENEWREVCAMMKLGYARVSTSEQDTAAQVSALKSAGCEKIFREKASGGRWDRPELHRLLDQLRKGDIVVCCRAIRASRFFSSRFHSRVASWNMEETQLR